MGGYKETKIFDIRKKKGIIIQYALFIALVFILMIIFITKSINNNQTLNIVYTENSNVDYKVYLKENDFFKDEYWDKDNQYIASLIDYIAVDFKYDLSASERNIDYSYTYKIVAETNVEDKTSQKSLYKFSEEILEEKEYDFNTNSKLRINESVKIDYNKYNDIIKRFVDFYDLDNNNATVTINMYVNVINDKGDEISKSDAPAMSLSIPLTSKTMAIDIESNAINGNDISVCKTIDSQKYLFITILLLFIEIVLMVKLIIFIKDTKTAKSIYNMQLRKIMSNYGSYIQKLNNEYNFANFQTLEIKSFEDLLQVRETINKPILMIEKTSTMETYFFIPSENNVYIYELKAGTIKQSK